MYIVLADKAHDGKVEKTWAHFSNAHDAYEYMKKISDYKCIVIEGQVVELFMKIEVNRQPVTRGGV